MKKTIKVLLFPYFEEVVSPHVVGQRVLVERNASFGDEVDIPREEDVLRGESLDAFYTPEEVKLIEKGEYRGIDRNRLSAIRAQHQMIQPLDDETSPDGAYGPAEVAGMSDEEIAEIIIANRLTVEQTLALAGTEDVGLMGRVLDAEGLVASQKDTDVRKGVTDGIEARLAAATS